MAQERPFHQILNDTTYTKIFVGGLAWETQMDTMKRYFEQFGEIHEAVVITDKHTGKSKGYGFVTFKDPNAAVRACQNPSPVIDGRRANCNLAILGATKPYPNFPPPTHPPHGGFVTRFRHVPGLVLPQPTYHPSSSNPSPHSPSQFPSPFSAYGYSGYSQSAIYPPPVSYYGGYGSQQYVPHYSSGVPSGLPNVYPNFYQYHGDYYGSHIARYGAQYPRQMMIQYPYWQQSYSSSAGILPLPSNLQPSPVPGLPLSATGGVSAPVTSATNSGVTIASPEQNSSTLSVTSSTRESSFK